MRGLQRLPVSDAHPSDQLLSWFSFADAQGISAEDLGL